MTDNEGRSLERPLNSADIANLKMQLANLDKVLLAIAKAKSAGVDTGNQEADAKAAKDKINKLLAAYS